MKKKITIKNLFTLVMIVAICCVLTGCLKDKLNERKPVDQTADHLPDFSTRSEIDLLVDYQAKGCKTLIEIFTEYPYVLDEAGREVKTATRPIFAAYTDNNGKFVGKMLLPTAVKKVYLYTPTMGLPRCLDLDVDADTGVKFQYSDLLQADSRSSRASVGSPSNGKFPYLLDASKKLNSLCQWNRYGKPKDASYITVNGDVSYAWIGRLQNALWHGEEKKWDLDNTNLLTEARVTNTTIAEFMENDEGMVVPVVSAKIMLTMIQEAGWNQNALGYYFYKGDEPNVNDLKKYIIFPNVSTPGGVPFPGRNSYGNSYEAKSAPLTPGSKVTLKYFDENGVASDEFPAGYTIGWFIISDAYNSENNQLNSDSEYIYSNENFNEQGKRRCISLVDTDTKRIVIGLEDKISEAGFEDILFFVEANPNGAILDPEKPVVPEKPIVPENPDASYELVGTLAFEDIWPSGGDYDMNDVVVKYKKTVYFNEENMITKIVDLFSAAHKVGGSGFNNAFAYQIDANQIGKSVIPEGVVYEEATHSYIVFPKTKDQVVGQNITITREFLGDDSFNKSALREYNPFIIINYVAENSQNRIEVHLPKKEATSYANEKLTNTGNDLFYIHKDGKYPFAIDLATWDFELVTEKSRIGSEGEYPKFNEWVMNGCGSIDADWWKFK